jgi:hypothetical protein
MFFAEKKKKKKKIVLSVDNKLKNLINLLGITNPKIVDVTRKTGNYDLLLHNINHKIFFLTY